MSPPARDAGTAGGQEDAAGDTPRVAGRTVPVSRPCYDKIHRCPGWVGGGMKSARVVRCDGGFLDPGLYERRLWKWRCNRCPTCRVLVLPSVIRYADPGWWSYRLRHAVRELRHRLRP